MVGKKPCADCSGPLLVYGCKGLQPSRSGTTIDALIVNWRASGPSAPCWAIGALFGREKAMCRLFGPFIGFRGCKGLQPSRSGTTIEALTVFLEGVRSPGAVLGDVALFGRDKVCTECWGLPSVGAFIGFRGCKGLQPSRSGTTIDALTVFLEGVRSLGAVLGDVSFVWSGQSMYRMLGPLLVSAAARDCSPPGQERLLTL